LRPETSEFNPAIGFEAVAAVVVAVSDAVFGG